MKVRKNKKASNRWARTKVLIIDEGELSFFYFAVDFVTSWIVSMVDGDLFDKLAELGSILRKSPLPFGGIQVKRHVNYNAVLANLWGSLL